VTVVPDLPDQRVVVAGGLLGAVLVGPAPRLPAVEQVLAACGVAVTVCLLLLLAARLVGRDRD
jgi:hypothetical protein